MQDPIKIRLTGDGRIKLQSRGVVPAMEDGDENAKAAFDALNRQKTNIVIKSEVEAKGVLRGVEKLNARSTRSCTWMSGPHKRAYSRVHSELISALKEREWCGYEPDTSVQINCKTEGCNSVMKGEVGETVRCFACNSEYTVEA